MDAGALISEGMAGGIAICGSYDHGGLDELFLCRLQS